MIAFAGFCKCLFSTQWHMNETETETDDTSRNTETETERESAPRNTETEIDNTPRNTETETEIIHQMDAFSTATDSRKPRAGRRVMSDNRLIVVDT